MASEGSRSSPNRGRDRLTKHGRQPVTDSGATQGPAPTAGRSQGSSSRERRNHKHKESQATGAPGQLHPDRAGLCPGAQGRAGATRHRATSAGGASISTGQGASGSTSESGRTPITTPSPQSAACGAGAGLGPGLEGVQACHEADPRDAAATGGPTSPRPDARDGRGRAPATPEQPRPAARVPARAGSAGALHQLHCDAPTTTRQPTCKPQAATRAPRLGSAPRPEGQAPSHRPARSAFSASQTLQLKSS